MVSKHSCVPLCYANRPRAEALSTHFQEFTNLVEKLDDQDISQQEKGSLTDKLFKLTEETRLVASIMDIQDELQTIKAVFRRQEHVLNGFVKLLQKPQGAETSAFRLHSSADGPIYRDSGLWEEQAKESLRLVLSNITTVEDMANDAEKIRKEVGNGDVLCTSNPRY